MRSTGSSARFDRELTGPSPLYPSRVAAQRGKPHLTGQPERVPMTPCASERLGWTCTFLVWSAAESPVGSSRRTSASTGVPLAAAAGTKEAYD